MNINEIAKLSGVSRATVSRYLNHGYVSQEKKEQIQKVIDDTGYQPSSSAQTLRSKKTNYIGVIIPKIDSVSIARVVKGISETLSEAGYQLLLACTNNQEREELKYLNLFKENHVDGIILLGTVFTKEHKKLLSRLSVPVIIVGQCLEDYTCIYHDDFGAAKAITAYLMPSSHKWGYLGVTPADEAVGRKRMQGFLEQLADSHKTIDADHMVETGFSVADGYEGARTLLSAHADIDTLLCATDTIAVGAMRYIHEAGLRIPQDIQLAGFGDGEISRITTPALSTVHFHYKTAGIEATRLLLDRIGSVEPYVSKQVKLGYSIVENDSVRT